MIAVAALATPAFADDLDFRPDRVTVRATGELGEDTQALALDGYYDVNARFRLGLTMSSEARYELGAIRGLCLHACSDPFGGLAADAEIRAGDHLLGRAAVDTTRFAPTAAAIELGFAAHYAYDRWDLLVAPVLRLGIARRDLANGDALSVFARVTARVWERGGVLAETRGAVDVDALRATPTLGAAGGVYVPLGAVTLTATFGSSNVAHTRSLFGELALIWSS
ncbi:MAG TPA: hypothetical protein VFQ65_33400 [Kofleriaceae bacterium]|nr:hypothetical protein [Kofleriaceae bacterium]